MSYLTLESFREELLRTGGYDSPAENLPRHVDKPGILTTLRLSNSLLSVFPKCSVYELFHCLNTDRWAHFCFRSFQTLESMGTPVHVEGWKNREAHEGPVVYVSNHMATLETIALPPILLSYGPFSIIVKASLSHLPFLEKAAAHMGLVPITRKSPREDLMTVFRVGQERIAAGGSFLIFPQGTRQAVFSTKKFSSIGAKLAEKAGVPVVPIAVKTDVQPTRKGGGFFKDFGSVDPSKDVRIACGPVLTGTAKEMHASSLEWIANKLESWQMPVER